MKIIIQFAVFLLLSVAVIFLLRISGILNDADLRMMQQKRRDQLIGKRRNRFIYFFNEIGSNLKQVGISKKKFMAMVLICFGIGALLGKILFVDTALSMATAAVVSLSPLAYLQIELERRKQMVVTKLESAMRCITNAYLANQDLTQAIQDNIEILEYPKPFKQYLVDVTYIDASVERALRRMEIEVDNFYFTQWINVLIQAQHDHNAASMAAGHVQRMNTARKKQIEANAMMYANWRTFFSIIAGVCCGPLIMRILFYTGFITLVTTPIGKGLILALLAAAVFATVQAIKINKPVTV